MTVDIFTDLAYVGESDGMFQLCILLNYTGATPMSAITVELEETLNGGDALSKSNLLIRI